MLYTTLSFVSYNYALKIADVCFLGIPYNLEYAPVLVRESLKRIDDSVNNKRIFENVKISDIGDMETSGSFVETCNRIKNTIQDVRNINNKISFCFIGGDHSITLPIVQVLRPKTVVQLDAHPDLRKEYLGEKYCYSTWAYHVLRMCKIIQVGVRVWSKEELSLKSRVSRKIKNIKRPVHMTIDMDVLEPSYVNVRFPEVNGLVPKDVIRVIKKVKPDSIDIVEINDNKLPSRTASLAGHFFLQWLISRFLK